MRKVCLHGHLGDLFGAEYDLEVATAGEAIRALNANFPGFVAALKEGSYELVRGSMDIRTGQWLELEDVNEFNLGKTAEFHIVPHVAGSKNAGGAIKIVLGVALVGAALFLSGGTLAVPLASSGLLSGVTFGNIAMIGLGLALAGVSSMLTHKDKTNPNQQASFTLSGPTNVYDQGNPVPLVYGEVITGSHLISGAIDIERIPVNWDPTHGNTNIGTTDPESGGGVVTGNPSSYTHPSGAT